MKTHFSKSVSALAIVAVFAGALCISSAALACGCGGGGGHGGGGGGSGGGGSGGGGGGSGGGGGGSGGSGGAGGGGGGAGAGGGGGGGADAGGGGGGAGAGAGGGGGAGGGDSHAELNGPNFSGSLTAFYSPRPPYLDPAVQAAYIANFGRRSVTGGKFDGAFDSIGAVGDGSTAQATADDGRRRNPVQSVALRTGRRAPTGGKFDARLADSGLAGTAEASSPEVSREALPDNTGRPHFDLQSAFAPDKAAQTAP
jgi:hypothetical protein